MYTAFHPLRWILALLLLVSCQTQAKKEETPAQPETEAPSSAVTHTLPPQDLEGYQTAYFASGCFWCVEAIFESVKGVKEAVSGYAGGLEKNPTYEEVSYGRTGHAETVQVFYDPEQVSFFELVQVFFGSHDPTTPNRQGPDRGAQYRSIAFYQTPEEQKIILAYMQALEENKVYDSPIVTEVTPFTTFYQAEDYHQDYERKHPNNPYVRNVSVPRLNRFKQNFPEYLKENAH
ncbi:peptide-methionine (S)-S-oxide reductase MsrA [Robiginitalea sp. M366]|uniref:peptide-methionine (S)-S-oxide reductase MsrA n=1 Tax=Robiginitalea aestuariiviva TaxID=3036903 RepID=UPI00240E0A13|nr:peptide-methionine (S)-S-oxide reductase MsrA [Robiginitalea aestuariiviva]MDG1572389.1 peptide-methionine (S)-S-oxide reductase MsrA [Robiginitalea aestuariiviva]